MEQDTVEDEGEGRGDREEETEKRKQKRGVAWEREGKRSGGGRGKVQRL